MPITTKKRSPIISRFSASLIAVFAALLTTPSLSSASTITFDDLGFVNGQRVNRVPGVTITAVDFNRFGRRRAVIFDSEQLGSNTPDLEARAYGLPRWSGGNLEGMQLNNVLTLKGCNLTFNPKPESDDRSYPSTLWSTTWSTTSSHPWDESHWSDHSGSSCGGGSRPCRPSEGIIRFKFDVPITSIGFALVNVDESFASEAWVTLRDIHYTGVTVLLSTLLEGLEIGANTANQIAPLTAEALGLGPIKSVTFLMRSDVGLDNITFLPIPEPATGMFLALGLALLAGSRRRA